MKGESRWTDAKRSSLPKSLTSSESRHCDCPLFVRAEQIYDLLQAGMQSQLQAAALEETNLYGRYISDPLDRLTASASSPPADTTAPALCRHEQCNFSSLNPVTKAQEIKRQRTSRPTHPSALVGHALGSLTSSISMAPAPPG